MHQRPSPIIPTMRTVVSQKELQTGVATAKRITRHNPLFRIARRANERSWTASASGPGRLATLLSFGVPVILLDVISRPDARLVVHRAMPAQVC